MHTIEILQRFIFTFIYSSALFTNKHKTSNLLTFEMLLCELQMLSYWSRKKKHTILTSHLAEPPTLNNTCKGLFWAECIVGFHCIQVKQTSLHVNQYYETAAVKISRIIANVFPGAADPHLEMWPIILRLHMQGENLRSANPQPFQIFISIIILKEHPTCNFVLSHFASLSSHASQSSAVKPEPNEVCECVYVSYLRGWRWH